MDYRKTQAVEKIVLIASYEINVSFLAKLYIEFIQKQCFEPFFELVSINTS